MAGIKITGADRQISRLQAIRKAANAQVMQKTMFFLRNRIAQRTMQGEFLNKSNAKYSTAGALYKITTQALKKEYLGRMKGTRVKKGESTARFVFLERGYHQYRNIHGRQTNYVDLNFDGAMLAAMNDISSSHGYASLGFTNSKEENKANWLSNMGAGKNKVKYEFFGLTEEDKDAVFSVFEEELTESLRELGVID